MVVPWLSLYGSTRHGLPGNELARNLAYEWIGAYVPVLWDESHALFRHDRDSGLEFFWARGNGWSLVALVRAAEALDAPYTGGRHDQVLSTSELREMLRASAESLLARQTADGGWGSYLSKPEECPVAETSGTALLTFFLARGVNEGWLDREVYQPVVLRAVGLLLRRVDAQGDVSGIQPPDVGPNCGKTTTNNERGVNVNYGSGAVLLALSEVMKFPG
jgi:rhamnogalacturonyl hydrolase YesR